MRYQITSRGVALAFQMRYADIRDSNVIREAGVGASKEAQHGKKRDKKLGHDVGI